MNLAKIKLEKKNFALMIVIIIVLLFGVSFFMIKQIPIMIEDMNKGSIYAMNHVELLETVKLRDSHSITYKFIAKQDVNNLGIVIHFDKFPTSVGDEEINKIEKIYKNTYIVLSDNSDNKILYSGTIGKNFINAQLGGISTWVPISSSINIIDNHQYSITINNLPLKTDLDEAYNSFILVVGNIEKPWL